MKKFIFPLTIFILLGCKKETPASNMLLKEVTVNGKVIENFTYNGNYQLVKDNYFGNCSIPYDEIFFIYKNNQLDSLKTVTRSLYSGISEMCNPLSGIHTYAAFEYDNQGRIIKIKKENSLVTNIYNSRGLIEKQILIGSGANIYESTFTYDTRGNLIEMTDGQGRVTSYQYDSKTNPYYLMKRHPDIITAFIVSPIVL